MHKSQNLRMFKLFFSSKAQSDIQLAKALSLSLASSSQQDDTETNEMVTSVILKPPTANQRPGKKIKNIW